MKIELRNDGDWARTVYTEAELDAPVDVVWGVWSDLEHHSTWNPVMTRIRGKAELDAEVKVGFRAGVMMVVRCVVDSHEPGRRLSWTGGARGVLSGHHYFECHPLPEGRTHIIHGETFSGLLVPLLWPVLGPQLKKNYRAMNNALAKHVQLQTFL